MDEQVAIARSEDETRPQLKRIPAQVVLVMARSFGPGSRLGVVAPQEMQQVSRFQFRGAVRGAIGIDEQRKSNAGLLAEGASIVHIAEADGGQRGSGLLELLLVLAQLRDMLTAENSAVVPQKDDDGRILFPQRSQANLAAAAFRQHDVREFRAEGFRHTTIVLLSGAALQKLSRNAASGLYFLLDHRRGTA